MLAEKCAETCHYHEDAAVDIPPLLCVYRLDLQLLSA